MVVRSFSEGQRLALARHAETGDAWCVLLPDGRGSIRVMRETDVTSFGPGLIDAVLWGTGVTGNDALDPALLA